jgi:hypothetical protein
MRVKVARTAAHKSYCGAWRIETQNLTVLKGLKSPLHRVKFFYFQVEFLAILGILAFHIYHSESTFCLNIY